MNWTIASLGFVSLCAMLPVSSTYGAVDLMRDATVRQNGTYTYFARGDASYNAITPFTKMFYPGISLHAKGTNTGTLDGSLQDTGSNAAPISIGSGELTDNNNGSYVLGWIDVEGPIAGQLGTTNAHSGDIDILIDLGAVYNLSKVVVNYSDASGQRWTTTGGAQQQVFTAMSFAGSTPVQSDFSLLSSMAFNYGASLADATFDAANPVLARYVLFRGLVQVNASPNETSDSSGGRLNDIHVIGDPVPEVTSLCLLATGAVSLSLRKRR